MDLHSVELNVLGCDAEEAGLAVTKEPQSELALSVARKILMLYHMP